MRTECDLTTVLALHHPGLLAQAGAAARAVNADLREGWDCSRATSLCRRGSGCTYATTELTRSRTTTSPALQPTRASGARTASTRPCPRRSERWLCRVCRRWRGRRPLILDTVAAEDGATDDERPR
eukprot:3074276-Pleurochrysis_carterae.AAC.1